MGAPAPTGRRSNRLYSGRNTPGRSALVIASNVVGIGIGILLRSVWNSRNPAPRRRKRRAKPATGHLPREDARARLYRRKRGDEAANRRLRGCAVTILDASKPFAPSRGSVWPMDSIASIMLPEDLDAGSDPRPAIEARNPSPLPSRNAECVHFEHAGQRAGEGEARQAEPATPAVAMSSYRLLICLAIIGWSDRNLARRIGRRQTTVARWAKGLSPVPGDVAAWLETLVAFHLAYPGPSKDQLANLTVSTN